MKDYLMKAYYCTKYGAPEVLQMREIPKPIPKDNQLLVKIKATSVTQSDIFIRSLNIPWKFKIQIRFAIGFTKPRVKVLGLVFSGVVESIGKNITKFKTGDEVYGMTGFSFGTYAEYMCMKENDSVRGCIATKPKTISHEEATSAAYGGLLAFQYMDKGNIQAGQKVLIYGASSNSGTIAVQYAGQLGADVSAVCSTANIDLVKSLGADRVFDYTKQDSLPAGMKFDFVLDAVGETKTSKLKEECKKALTATGKYVSIDDGNMQLESTRLQKITQYIDSGGIKPILDRVYPFEELVEAHRYVEKGHKIGGVAISL